MGYEVELTQLVIGTREIKGRWKSIDLALAPRLVWSPLAHRVN